MNSVKNAIVTMTLLAVGYGAYVVLSNPVPEDLGELADGSVWAPPEVTTPETSLDAEGSLSSLEAPPPLSGDGTLLNEGAPADSPTVAVQLPSNDVDGYGPPSEIDRPTSTDLPATSAADSSTGGLSLATPQGASPPARSDEGRFDPPSNNVETDAGANFYVSRSADPTPDTDAYPTTSAPETPWSDPNGAPGSTALSTEPVSPADDDSLTGFERTWQTAQADLRSGQLGSALAALSAWYEEASLTPAQENRLLPLLDQLAGTVIYSRDSFLEPAHVVQQGETLDELSRQYQVPLEFLARINGIEAPYEVYPGESLKVIRGPFRAEVSQGRGQITLFLGRYYAGRFQARVGAQLPPQEATYDVVSIDPGLEYFDPQTGNRIARDAAENPYGGLWISLRGHQITAAHDVGIHIDGGDPERCCVAVSPADGQDLAAILGPGSSVTVKP